MPRSAPRTTYPDDSDPYRPDGARPVRLRSRILPADSHFDPHSHGWAQLAYCASGVLLVTALQAATGKEVTYVVPPSRAVWIAPGARHAVHVLEDARFRTLYIDASATPTGWESSRVIVVSDLLRELVQALDAPHGIELQREQRLTSLLLDEIGRAPQQSLGVPMPPAQDGDKRLRALCESVLRAPARHTTLSHWAAGVGASERTLARLFREQLGTSFHQWRQQAILAHALPMLARGVPVSQVAQTSGYASDSAFSAMFKAAMGQSPSRFLGGR
jgi:AraC-like DNA-binding protein/quercetin dioxygenase-like cupin family protein